jgi:hypothetical protein
VLLLENERRAQCCQTWPIWRPNIARNDVSQRAGCGAWLGLVLRRSQPDVCAFCRAACYFYLALEASEISSLTRIPDRISQHGIKLTLAEFLRLLPP